MALSTLATQISPIVRPFVEADVWLLERDDLHVSPEFLRAQSRLGPCFTFEYEGILLGCVGAIGLLPGVASVWMALTDHAASHGLWLTKTIKAMLADLIRAFGLHRVEALVLVTSARNQRWIEMLGFTCERNGTARQFLSDRRDMLRYEWVKE